MACCAGLAKFVLVIFNLLLCLAGLVPFVFGIVAITSADVLRTIIDFIPGTGKVQEIVDLNALIRSGATYFIVIGVIIAVIGFIGCFGACCSVRWLLYLYLTLLVLIVLAEVAVIIVAVVSPSTFSSEAQKVMKATLKDFKTDCNVTSDGTVGCGSDAMSLAWHTMQYELRCCGSVSYTDYDDGSAPNFQRRSAGALAPLTCCVRSDGGSDQFDPDKIAAGSGECYTTGLISSEYYDTGCFNALLRWMTTSAVVIGVMAGIGALELILIVLTIVQLCSLRRSDSLK